MRGEYSWRAGGGTDWQVALEGAYNISTSVPNLRCCRPMAVPARRFSAATDEGRGSAAGVADACWAFALASERLTARSISRRILACVTTSSVGRADAPLRPAEGQGRAGVEGRAQDDNPAGSSSAASTEPTFDFASSVDVANGQGNGQQQAHSCQRSPAPRADSCCGIWARGAMRRSPSLALPAQDPRRPGILLSPTTEGRASICRPRIIASVRRRPLARPAGVEGRGSTATSPGVATACATRSAGQQRSPEQGPEYHQSI